MRLGNGTTISGARVVGTINRPRLPIFPSILLLASLLAIALVLNLRSSGEDVLFNLWVFVTQKGDKDNTCNPLRSPSVELVTDSYFSFPET